MRSRAFTIVELLIAIVVVAVLASVSVVAYNGVQQRATNSSVVSALNNVEKYLKAYNAQNGSPLRFHPDDVQAAASQSPYITDPYYTSVAERAGVCIGSKWPQEIVSSGYEAMWDYCDSNPNNSGINRGLATELFDRAVKRSGDLLGALPAMPSYNPVNLFPSDKSNPIKQRGIRLANIVAQDKSYLFYALNGKSCQNGDRRVNFSDTQWIDYYSSNGQDIPSSGFDADFTQNNTVYCARTIQW